MRDFPSTNPEGFPYQRKAIWKFAAGMPKERWLKIFGSNWKYNLVKGAHQTWRNWRKYALRNREKPQLMYATILCRSKRDDWKQFWPTGEIILNIRTIFHVCNEYFFCITFEILLLSFMFIKRIRSFDVIFCWKML